VVNVASRLEGLGKELGAEILISEETRKLAGEGLATKAHGAALLKGRTGKVRVFELLGFEACAIDEVDHAILN
jgi:adenylate cyclase